MRQRFAVEEVGDEDAILVLSVVGVGVGEDVGALEDLGGEAEDVGDEEDGDWRWGGRWRL